MHSGNKPGKTVDAGSYHRDPALYEKLVHELYEQYPHGVTLPPEYAAHVENDLLRLTIFLARYKFVARLIRKTDHVLEIGSGSGLGSIFLGQHAGKVSGIDIRTTAVEEAQALNHNPNIDFQVADFFELGSDSNYDVILALDVIEHMPAERGDELLAQIAKKLKPTGMAVIGTPSVYSWEYQSALSKASHVKCYDRDELLQAMDRHFGRCTTFSMNDELVHTGFHKMAWYYFALGFAPNGAAHG